MKTIKQFTSVKTQRICYLRNDWLPKHFIALAVSDAFSRYSTSYNQKSLDVFAFSTNHFNV